MGNSSQFTVEVHFVPLPPQELDERRRRLAALLLRGALRLTHQAQEPEPEEVLGPAQR